VVVKESPGWARMRVLPLRAPATGVVVEVQASAGTWIDRDEVLVKILDSAYLGFRALIPEADVARFPDVLAGTIEASGVEGVFDMHEAAVRPVADASTRSVLLEAEVENPDGKLRVGTSATARVLMSRSASEEVLVPLVCVVRDGLESVVYCRDPANADRVIRTVVTLGDSSAGWAEVIAGVGAGDQLVEDGVHQLRQTGLGKASASGHFHADGTWHTGDK